MKRIGTWTFLLILATVTGAAGQKYTRGIGVYPGDPTEDYAPDLVQGKRAPWKPLADIHTALGAGRVAAVRQLDDQLPRQTALPQHADIRSQGHRTHALHKIPLTTLGRTLKPGHLT